MSSASMAPTPALWYDLPWRALSLPHAPKLMRFPVVQYTAAAKNSSIETVSKALESLSATFKKEPKLQQILASPTLTVDDKKQIVAELQKGISVQDKTNTVSGFLNTLAENNRLSVLEGVTEKFAQLMSASRGEVELNITSAAPLDNKVIKQLEAAVSKSQYVGANKKVKVVAKVSLQSHMFSMDTGEDPPGGFRVLTLLAIAGQPGYPRWSGRGDWRPHNRPIGFLKDAQDEQVAPRDLVNILRFFPERSGCRP